MSSTGARSRKDSNSRIADIAIKDEEKFIQDLKVFGNSNSGQANAGQAAGNALATAGEASNAKIKNLGDLTDPFVIDFATMDTDSLFGNIKTNTVITFTNIPADLFMNLRLYIRVADPIITIDGVIASGIGSGPPVIVTVVDDFLDISLRSINQVDVIIGTVKKNDKADVIAGIPINVQVVGNSASTINVIWDPPITGSQPIKYDVAFSLGSAGSAVNGPDVDAPGSPDNDLTSNEHNITGLVSATTYFVWIRAKNDLGASDYVGPFQTNTDGISNPGGVNFAIPGGTVLFDSITATWDQPGGALFSLTRTNTVTGEIEELQNFKVSDADVVDNKGILPLTNYDYKLTTFNGFGAILGSQIINVTTPDLPKPVLVLTNSGRKLNFAIDFLADIGIAEFQWALDAAFTSGVSSIRSFARPVPFIIETKSVQSPDLAADTLFFGRVRFVRFGKIGPFSTISHSATTGTLLTSSRPTITVTSPSTGIARIKVKYEDSITRDEIALVTWRLASSVQEYFDTIFDVGTIDIANSYSRNQPPSDDLNSLENRVEVLREGAFPNGVSITFRCVCVNASGTSIADSVNAIIDT